MSESLPPPFPMPAPLPLPPPDEKATIRTARWKSMLVPGAGFGTMGYIPTAIACMALLWVCLGSIAFAAIWFSPAALWTLAVLLAAVVILWVIEYIVVAKMTLRPAHGGAFSRRFRALCIVTYLGATVVAVVMVASLGVIRIAGAGMSPTVSQDDLLVFSRRVPAGRIENDRVILFRHDFPADGRSGVTIISRILAGPGDTLSSDGTRYYVNGVAGPAHARLQYAAKLSVPISPTTLTVPPDCYFVVQDNYRQGMDSRQLEWINRNAVIATDVMHVNGSSAGSFIR